MKLNYRQRKKHFGNGLQHAGLTSSVIIKRHLESFDPAMFDHLSNNAARLQSYELGLKTAKEFNK